MTTLARTASLIASSLLLLSLSGCAGHRMHAAHAQADGGTMDMQAMCERHRSMTSGMGPEEQQAMMQEHMKSMSPEMRQRMQAMHQRCN